MNDLTLMCPNEECNIEFATFKKCKDGTILYAKDFKWKTPPYKDGDGLNCKECNTPLAQHKEGIVKIHTKELGWYGGEK